MEMEIVVFIAEADMDEDERETRLGGRNTPSPLRPSEVMNFAFSSAASMIRLPPPVGTGIRSLATETLEDWGTIHPIAMPVLVEKDATGMLDLRDLGFCTP